MKKVLLFSAAAGLALTSCEVRDPSGDGSSSLTVDQTQHVLVMETTGAWCGWCPNGAVALAGAMVDHSNILPMAVHNGDGMVTPTTEAFEAMFPVSGVPNFYVGSSEAGQSIDGPITALAANIPPAGVAHASSVVNGEIKVTGKIAFFAPDTGTYKIQAYYINGEVAAEASSVWGDMTQSDYTDDLETVGGVSSWVNPRTSTGGTTVFNAGDVYMHDHALLAHAGADPFGDPVSSGTTFSVGDTYNFNLTIPVDSKWNLSGSHVITVLWKDNGGTLEFVNGYMD